MSKYTISIKGYYYKFLGELEAESEEDALDKADETFDTSAPSICHYCSKEVEINDPLDVEADLVEETT